MYIVTFYSFKGGVGRTMAMVNIGVKLARNGRRVLLVDFDLEAPSLETFNLLKPEPEKETLGIVDYITHYMENNQTPDISKNYIYESVLTGDVKGNLWVMPSGKQDNLYQTKLSQIDWQNLYKEKEGYLMMEDLKKQWERKYKPDYVFIDSRTGHSDIGGICTRQLPDAVVMLFFPNEQNLVGLEKIVPAIRKETEGPRKKNINLHFVTANVPDLDDENQILEKRHNRFRETLNYTKLHFIHHYPSLALLNQEIFTETHPSSRLAREYTDVYYAIIRANLADKEGVVHFLKEANNEPYEIVHAMSPINFDLKLQNIFDLHCQDEEILVQLAELHHSLLGQDEKALDILNQLIDSGKSDPKVLLLRANIAWPTKKEQALKDIILALNSEDLSVFNVNKAIKLLQRIEKQKVEIVPTLPAFKSLDLESQLEITRGMSTDRNLLIAFEANLKYSPYEEKDEKSISNIRQELALVYIGVGKYKEAIEVIGPLRSDSDLYNIGLVFNYAMAEWAETKSLPIDLFERVIELRNENIKLENSANYLQCLAIANWAVGNIDVANEFVDRAAQNMKSHPHSDFSAWRYLTVSSDEFIQDLGDIKKLIDGDNLLPQVFKA